jgi:HPt (histidine-containing phosphotransfer) domain-containing protein
MEFCDKKPILEHLALIGKRMGRQAALKLVSAYEFDMNGIEAKLRDALVREDAEALRATCHFLTGCTKTLGAKETARLYSEMGARAVDGSWAEIQENGARMVNTVGTVLEILRAYAQDEDDKE